MAVLSRKTSSKSILQNRKDIHARADDLLDIFEKITCAALTARLSPIVPTYIN